MSLGLSEIVRDNIYKDFTKQAEKVQEWINQSFLKEEYKERYMLVFGEKMKQIGL